LIDTASRRRSSIAFSWCFFLHDVVDDVNIHTFVDIVNTVTLP